MAVVSNRPPGHPPPGMPDYDDLCDDLTYDELTDGMSTCSGSVNDLLDQLDVEEDNSQSEDGLLDNITVPDTINLHSFPAMNGHKLNGGMRGAEKPTADRPPGEKMTIFGSSSSSTPGYQAKQNGSMVTVNGTISTANGNTATANGQHMAPGVVPPVRSSASGSARQAEPARRLPETPESAIVGEFMRVREQKFSNLSNGQSDNGTDIIGSIENSRNQQNLKNHTMQNAMGQNFYSSTTTSSVKSHTTRMEQQHQQTTQQNWENTHQIQHNSQMGNNMEKVQSSVVPQSSDDGRSSNGQQMQEEQQQYQQKQQHQYQGHYENNHTHPQENHPTRPVNNSWETQSQSQNSWKQQQQQQHQQQQQELRNSWLNKQHQSSNGYESQERRGSFQQQSSPSRSSWQHQQQEQQEQRGSFQQSSSRSSWQQQQQQESQERRGSFQHRYSSSSTDSNRHDYGSNRNKTCPSPSFDARSLKSGTPKWSSTEDITYKDPGSFRDLPQTWTPRNLPSPSLERRDFKPVNFDSNSLKRNKRSVSSEGSSVPEPKDSFAWKDSTLDRKLKELKEKNLSDAPVPKHRNDDPSLERTLQNWKSKPLPKVEDPDVLLLKKARQEKKVKRYLEDNFQNREGNYSESELESDIGTLSSKYNSYNRERNTDSSPPRSPPPFSKAESRFEREQKIKVGSLDSFSPGNTREKSLSPPPAASSAQAKYEKDRFRVQPRRIEEYAPGRCSVNQHRSQSTIGGCGITKYASSHSFNPLLSSKSEHNLSIKKDEKLTNGRGNHLQKTIKDGYESDSTLVYRKHTYNPTESPSPSIGKSVYSQVQRGGEVPLQGLRMQQPPEKDYSLTPSIKVFQVEENKEGSRPTSSASSKRWESQRWGEMREVATEEEVRKRQQDQLTQFYNSISQQKEEQLRRDQENRKHHDTLLPSQKSPVPHNRFEEQDVNGNQAVFLNAGRKPEDCKMVARALFTFQAQNHRELNFKKGDIIYIKKQIDNNWYEGERNGVIGILPTTYVEILPSESAVSREISNSLSRKSKFSEGEGRAKFNFTAQTPMELSLLKGETVQLLRKVDKNWLEGKIGSRKGIFPVSYIEILVEPGKEMKSSTASSSYSITKSSTLPSSSYLYEKPRSAVVGSPYSTSSRPGSGLRGGIQQQQQPTAKDTNKPEPVPYRAMYNYKPQNEDEVELCEGDVVFVMEKCDDGWFVGTSQRTGIFGTFPGNYVTQI